MKFYQYIITGMVVTGTVLVSCKKTIDVDPISNVSVDTYYRNYEEVTAALAGCYNGLHQPLETEWMLTELRSDNAKQGVPNSSSVPNIELNQLDMFTLNSTQPGVYDYWLSVYKNIRSINYVLKSLGVEYSNETITLGTATAQVTEEQRKQLASEALFLRAYHYFNLVRLYGGVFLITQPLDPQHAKQINRSSLQDCYKLIIADLTAAKDWFIVTPYGQTASQNIGKANGYAAKALLAKVYLTLDQNPEALDLLNDVIDHSGYGLEDTYSEVFAIDNEMNKEILFAVRYKSGSVGLGNPMANYFAPTGSGSAVVNGDGNGYNYPTDDIIANYIAPASGSADSRKAFTIGTYGTKVYMKKYLSDVLVKFDAENDFPVIRFADVLLMKAEATGYDGPAGSSVAIINQVRQRAGATTYSGSGSFNAAFYTYPATGPNAIADEAQFKAALSKERRLELAYENQRFFDLVRTGEAIDRIKDHFAEEFDAHYSRYTPAMTLEELQSNVNQDRLLLPIPQRELDTNDQIDIAQNPGY